MRLILVPRHRERFDEVAGLVVAAGLPLLRRSEVTHAAQSGLPSQTAPVILLDTIGELSACWGLADIAFVGGSFGQRGGQNMIEPAAYGACIMFGPNTWNFRDVVESFRDAGACIELSAPSHLAVVLRQLVAEPDRRRQIGRTAQDVVRCQQGATRQTVALLTELVAADFAIPESGRRAA